MYTPLLLCNTHTWLAGSEIEEEYAQGVRWTIKMFNSDLNCFLKGFVSEDSFNGDSSEV